MELRHSPGQKPLPSMRTVHSDVWITTSLPATTSSPAMCLTMAKPRLQRCRSRATEGDCGLRETTTRDDTVRTKRGNANSPHNSPHTMAPLQSKADWCKFLKGLEARAGIEPAHKGFADLSLTTWVPRHGLPASKAADRSKPPAAQRGLEPGTAEWSGRRDLNSRPSPWQGDALPLSYSRFDANQSIPGGGKWVKQSALCGLRSGAPRRSGTSDAT
jgi:hypothetical protein